ncbi:HAMP domain-containing histidine kinase [Microbulbifer sp. CAU 1566]|uniref:sensor histidine kinase n=1 Tax=Microbulbifer sp. CAU 1566 TaxID=2933269 RepID=UPI002004DA5D|nr:HAMP domain-containing sensor histidine kinase [Microbulbifer sp. CAU 1566]MCK7599019.1 HAMP domain-containing histidine kinase [Microbulbifer sp. CAU 1566]
MQTEIPKGRLKRKVLTLFGGFTLLLCLIYSSIGVIAAYVIEDQLIDNLINSEIDYIEQHFREHGELPSPRLPQFTLYTSPAKTPPEFVAALGGERRRAELFVTGQEHYHLRELTPETGAILASEVGNLLTVSSQSGRLVWTLIATFLCTTALALWLAHRLITSTVRPILSLARELESQAVNTPSLALTTSNRNDEIGFLARTLERNLRELQQARQREAEFTRDVSHEFRTNLAVASNTISLCGNRGLNVSETQGLGAILANMNRTVTTLLALARSESFARKTFDLRPLLEGRLLARPEISLEDSFEVDLTLPATLPVTGNPHLTELLLDILLDNAIRYALQPKLTIFYSGDAIVFENPIRTTFETETLFNAGVRGESSRENSEGIGQGLYLASRILTAQQWHYAAECHNGTFSISISVFSDKTQ